MMPTDRFERQLPVRLTDLAEPQTPDYFADLLAQTAHTSQRRAWAFPERWLPLLEITRRPVAIKMPWQPVAVLSMIVVALLASLVLAGSQRPLPPAFGPAANGLIVHSEGGDILTFDPRTGVAARIVQGPEVDFDPVWSSSGTHLLFKRQMPAQAGGPDTSALFLARANGSGLRRLTPDPVAGLLSYELSPDGKTVAFTSTVNGIPSLFVANSDGSGVKRIETGTITWGATFRPTGSDLLFVGARGVDRAYSGIYLVDADGSNLRTLVQPQVDAQIEGDARWSPDGTHIAYARWEPSVVPQDLRIHVMGADGTGDTIVGHQDGAWLEGSPVWSPDGKKLVIERNVGTASETPSHPSAPAIVSVAGTTPDVGVRFEMSEFGTLMAWSPDGTAIQATPIDDQGNELQQLLWDPLTGGSKTAPWAARSYPSWQRIAP